MNFQSSGSNWPTILIKSKNTIDLIINLIGQSTKDPDSQMSIDIILQLNDAIKELKNSIDLELGGTLDIPGLSNAFNELSITIQQALRSLGKVIDITIDGMEVLTDFKDKINVMIDILVDTMGKLWINWIKLSNDQRFFGGFRSIFVFHLNFLFNLDFSYINFQ